MTAAACAATSRRARERARLEEERNRLAALMRSLPKCVCNAEGRILLYNERARQLFSGDEALLGLGRSLFGLIDREQVAHARDKLQAARRSRASSPQRPRRLLKVQAAPVAGEAAIAGMVLTLEDVTGVLDREQQRLRLLHALTSSVRSPAANLRAAAENLASYPDMDAERRLRFIQIVAAESAPAVALDRRGAARLRRRGEGEPYAERHARRGARRPHGAGSRACRGSRWRATW